MRASLRLFQKWVAPVVGVDEVPVPRGRQLNAARQFFRKGGALLGTDADQDILDAVGWVELVLVGRSNAGKTTLLNGLLAKHGGRQFGSITKGQGGTREMYFYGVGEKAAKLGSKTMKRKRNAPLDAMGPVVVVDVPGYGFSKVDRERQESWGLRFQRYLDARAGSSVIRRVLVLVDGRHGIQDADSAMLEMLESVGIPYMMVLTKMDSVATLNPLEQVSAQLAGEGRHLAFPAIVGTAARLDPSQSNVPYLVDILGLAMRLDDLPLSGGLGQSFRRAQRRFQDVVDDKSPRS